METLQAFFLLPHLSVHRRHLAPAWSAHGDFVKTPSGTWKALIRRQGWPATIKTFRTKRDAEDWARRTEDERVRGVCIRRTTHERTPVADALDRYEREVPLKKASTQASEGAGIREVKAFFGKYSLAAVSPDLVAEFRGKRLVQGTQRKSGLCSCSRTPA